MAHLLWDVQGEVAQKATGHRDLDFWLGLEIEVRKTCD